MATTRFFHLTLPEDNAMRSYHLPQLIFCLGLAAFCTASELKAGPLDGRYLSNKGNFLDISGNRHTYTHNRTGKTKSGSVHRIGANRVQFTGGPKYACEVQGSVLFCDGGRRIWKKQ
jgi:hypothetical protein